MIEEVIMEEDLLKNLHWEEGYYVKDLAEAWNEKYSTIWNKFRMYKIDIILQDTHHFSIFDKIDSNTFDKLYYMDDLSGNKVAEIMGFEMKTLYKWMQLNGRPTKQFIRRNYPPSSEKLCYVCKEYVPLEKFSKTAITYDGYMSRCKSCDHKIGKEYKMNNEEKIKQKNDKKRNTIEYRINSRYKGYRERHKEKFNSDIPITIEEVTEIIIKPCFYCGEKDIPVNGLDRVDNTKGYEKDNVVSCCRNCNTMKLTLTVDEFKKKIIKIYNHICIDDINGH